MPGSMRHILFKYLKIKYFTFTLICGIGPHEKTIVSDKAQADTCVTSHTRSDFTTFLNYPFHIHSEKNNIILCSF